VPEVPTVQPWFVKNSFNTSQFVASVMLNWPESESVAPVVVAICCGFGSSVLTDAIADAAGNIASAISNDFFM
jgi:hypothetical protein